MIGESSIQARKKKVWEKNKEDWRSEVEGKVSLNRYGKIMENLEAESYIGAQSTVRLRFRLRSCSTDLGGDNLK